jgi:hypothetical protein
VKRLLALILVLQSSTSLAQTATEPEATTVRMGDDGYVEVPLEFEFPLFQELFSTSWMYDNGIISFIQPGQPGSISPYQWSALPIDQVGANYFIASLWADIAPNSSTKYTYSGDATQMKYTWTNIAEFYSAGSSSPRYSTFSTTIKPDGSIGTSFASVNLQTSNVSSGVVGNKSSGEFQSFYYSSYGSPVNISDWTYVGTYVPPPPPPPPPPEPPPLPPDPIPVQEFVEEPTVYEPVAPQESAPPAPVAEPPPTQTVAAAAAETPTQQVVQQLMAPTPETSISQTTQALPSVSAQASSDKKIVSVDAQSIAKNNQRNLAALTDSVVSTSIQGSMESGTKSAESSMSSSSTSVSGTSIKVGEQTIANAVDSVNQTQNQTQSISSATSDSSKSTSASATTSSTQQSRNQTSKVSEGGSEQSSSSMTQNSENQTQSTSKVYSEVALVSTNTTATQDLSSQMQSTGQQETYQATAVDQYASLIQPPVFTQEQQEDTQVVEPTIQSLEDTLAMFKPYAGASDVSSETAQDFINSQIDEQTSIANVSTEVANISVTDDINPTSIRSLSNAVLAMRAIEEEEQKKEVADKVPDNDPALAELAESGAKLEALQVVPVGYFNYLNLAYKDVAFYKDRKIYRKQKVVDNLRILRAINARDNKTFSSMINSQYNLEDF